MRIKIAERYSDVFLEIERPQPLTDNKIENLIDDIKNNRFDKDFNDSLYEDFKTNLTNWLLSSSLNKIINLDKFCRSDICIGCTQFIDSIYMKGKVQVLENDYRYHQRLGYAKIRRTGELIEGVPLIISLPFPSTGSPHLKMSEILNECIQKNIPVHIDGAWITCAKDIVFDFDHPSIESVAISLSKGLGLGWNRIGLCWTKKTENNAISLMNDFSMINRVPVMIANHFLKNLDPDHLWKKHGKNHAKICRDFDLKSTNSIHIALRDNQPVGLSPLLRYLENAIS